MSNVVAIADPAKGEHCQERDGLVSAPGQVVNSHAAFGQDGVNLAGKGFDGATLEKSAPFIFPTSFRNSTSVNFQTWSIGGNLVELASGQAQLGTVDVYVTYLGRGEPAPATGFDVVVGQTEKAMARQAALQA